MMKDGSIKDLANSISGREVSSGQLPIIIAQEAPKKQGKKTNTSIHYVPQLSPLTLF
jgi:hypothetical protein